MSTTLRQLAELVGGQLQGPTDLVIHRARPLRDAEPGDISFIESEKYAALLHECRASAIVVSESLPTNGHSVIRVADPMAAFVAIARHLSGQTELPVHGVDPKADVHATAVLGADVSVHAFASVGAGSVLGARCRLYPGAVVGRNCRLGDDVVLYPNAVLYDGTVLGNRVVVHGNSVIGADGFGYRFQQGRHVKVPQLGHVEVGDDVEIGACTTVDRGTFQPTRIGSGTKVDNLVQIAHNCQIGPHNILISQVGIAGSSSTGEYVTIAGQAGINNGVHIGDRVLIGAQAGVVGDVEAGQRVFGAPARLERAQKRILASLEKLPDLRRNLRRVMKHVGLEDEIDAGKSTDSAA